MHDISIVIKIAKKLYRAVLFLQFYLSTLKHVYINGKN